MLIFYSNQMADKSGDTNELKSNFWEIKQTFFSGGLNFGYRFPLKETPNIKKMKEHKLYKLL